jgi:hypothetical protein
MSETARRTYRHRRLPHFGLAQPAVLRGRMLVTKVLPYQSTTRPTSASASLTTSPRWPANELQILDQFGLQDGQKSGSWPNGRASRAVFAAASVEPVTV